MQLLTPSALVRSDARTMAFLRYVPTMFGMIPRMKTRLLLIAIFLLAPMTFAEDSEQLLTVDHYVGIKSTVPAISGQTTQIYVRERTKAATALRSSSLARPRRLVHPWRRHTGGSCFRRSV